MLHLKPLFQRVLVDLQYTQYMQWLFTLEISSTQVVLFCETCEADSSSGDVVIYWIITDTHIEPDRQQYDEHTHQADTIWYLAKRYVR